MAFRHLPLTIYNSKCDVFVWCTSMKADCQCIICAVLLKEKLRSLRLVGQVWVKDIEFVALHNLGRRIF